MDDFDINDRLGETTSPQKTKKKLRFADEIEELGNSFATPDQKNSFRQNDSVILDPYKLFATDPKNPYEDLKADLTLTKSEKIFQPFMRSMSKRHESHEPQPT
jgi:hypothetical protein